jgi:hypothetical protein
MWRRVTMTDACCGPLDDDNAPVVVQMTYFYILDAFPRLARVPRLEELEGDLLLSRDRITTILDALSAEGALRVEPASYLILEAYPYSGVPTRHHIHFREGGHVYTACAVDAFYVPFLTGHDITIRSRCFHCRAEIEIEMKGHGISRAEPTHSVVWNSARAYDCPKTNFFCSEAHLSEWRETAPDEKGQVYTLADALDAGKRAADRITRAKDKLNGILWAGAGELVCYCREVPKATVVAAIARGAASIDEIAKETTACTGHWCERVNPNGRCCCTQLEALLDAYA